MPVRRVLLYKVTAIIKNEGNINGFRTLTLLQTKNNDGSDKSNGATTPKGKVDINFAIPRFSKHRPMYGRFRRKPLSPEDRLRTLFEDSDCHAQRPSDKLEINENKSDALVNDTLDQNDQSADAVGERLKSDYKKTEVKPVHRLMKMIPDDYWENIDRDTKNVIDELEDVKTEDENKDKKKP